MQLSRHAKCPHQHPLTHPTNTCHNVFIQAIHISKPQYLLTYYIFSCPHQDAKNHPLTCSIMIFIYSY
jgi:hypothetical protein